MEQGALLQLLIHTGHPFLAPHGGQHYDQQGGGSRAVRSLWQSYKSASYLMGVEIGNLAVMSNLVNMVHMVTKHSCFIDNNAVQNITHDRGQR